jgi:hypothetical protein
MAYPKTYDPDHTPVSVRVLLEQVLPRLLEGGDRVLEVLREQLRHATVTSVELSGVGFFAHLAVPPTLPLADPRRIVGGDAEIALAGVAHGAGCVLFIDDGRLSMFEGYTYAGEEWPESAAVTAIGDVSPVTPANQALQSDGRVGRSAPSRVRR